MQIETTEHRYLYSTALQKSAIKGHRLNKTLLFITISIIYGSHVHFADAKVT